ncbi:helix-turn-helix domain-containing protein [Paenibacillus daejeonensis]|uniref:helix-turn-helix domain-containing protein n=1 Tax=Paenibacillus daejeonensis TaxID=135193 RepID=UPI00035ED9F5|nr:helix-turn-helix transcriptional regulator [Paenibacillus daejeonensis]
MIGERIRELRKARNMTQKQLAAILNSAKSTISQYENNINEPDLETVMKIADCFGVTVDSLLGRDRSDKPTPASSEHTLVMEVKDDDEAGYVRASLELYRKFRTADVSKPYQKD